MIAVHGGVSFNASEEHSKLCGQAICRSTDVISAVKILEDDRHFNCGFGSNFTYHGNVECEAAYMSSPDFRFGAIGATSRIRNPVHAAKELALCTGVPGLVKPLILVGDGAESWAGAHDIPLIDSTTLQSKFARKEWEDGQKRLSDHLKTISNDLPDFSKCKFDTVGAVSIKDSVSEACVSSGGVIMKHEGRLGHSTTFGAGIWTQNQKTADGDKIVAVSVSGCGEALIRTDFARSLARSIIHRPEEALPVETCSDWFQGEFLSSPFLQDFPRNMLFGGAIVMIEEFGHAELLFVHNTKMFPIAFKNRRGKVKTVLSVLSSDLSFKCDTYSLN